VSRDKGIPRPVRRRWMPRGSRGGRRRL